MKEKVPYIPYVNGMSPSVGYNRKSNNIGPSGERRMYLYHFPVYSEEHMLFVSEIAEKYGLCAQSGNPHTKLAKIIVEEYCRDKGVDIAEIGYITKYGWVQVYPREYYVPAMEDFLQKYPERGQKQTVVYYSTAFVFVLKNML